MQSVRVTNIRRGTKRTALWAKLEAECGTVQQLNFSTGDAMAIVQFASPEGADAAVFHHKKKTLLLRQRTLRVHYEAEAAANASCDELSRKLYLKTEEALQFATRLKAAEDAGAKLRAENEGLKRQLDKALAQAESFRADAERSRMVAEERAHDAWGEVEGLRKKCEELAGEVLQGAAYVIDSKAENEDLRRRLDQVEKKLAKKKSLIHECAQELELQATYSQDLKKKLAHSRNMEAQLRQAQEEINVLEAVFGVVAEKELRSPPPPKEGTFVALKRYLQKKWHPDKNRQGGPHQEMVAKRVFQELEIRLGA